MAEPVSPHSRSRSTASESSAVDVRPLVTTSRLRAFFKGVLVGWTWTLFVPAAFLLYGIGARIAAAPSLRKAFQMNNEDRSNLALMIFVVAGLMVIGPIIGAALQSLAKGSMSDVHIAGLWLLSNFLLLMSGPILDKLNLVKGKAIIGFVAFGMVFLANSLLLGGTTASQAVRKLFTGYSTLHRTER